MELQILIVESKLPLIIFKLGTIANDVIELLCPYREVIISKDVLLCIRIEPSALPLIILEFWKTANAVTTYVCLKKVLIILNGYTDCHTLIVKSALLLTILTKFGFELEITDIAKTKSLLNKIEINSKDVPFHILIVLSSLPLTIFKLGKISIELIERMCPVNVAIHSYGNSDCHILIVVSWLPLIIKLELLGKIANALTELVCPFKVVINLNGFLFHIWISESLEPLTTFEFGRTHNALKELLLRLGIVFKLNPSNSLIFHTENDLSLDPMAKYLSCSW